jgi:truncated hemoglobin YjbI
MNNLNITDDELETWLKKINKVFYDKIFADNWLGQVFKGIDQDFIQNQQTDFILGALGGSKRYSGRNPDQAHPHIFIDEEMWQHREHLLKSTFKELSVPLVIEERWLKIDNAFKSKIVMKDESECKPRYAVDEFIIIPKPKDF